MDDALPYTYDPLLSTSPTIKGGKIDRNRYIITLMLYHIFM